jgi:hypothetical protein
MQTSKQSRYFMANGLITNHYPWKTDTKTVTVFWHVDTIFLVSDKIFWHLRWILNLTAFAPILFG